MAGSFKVYHNQSEKILAYRAKLCNIFGITTKEIHYHVCRHHCNKDVLCYLKVRNKNVITPILKSEASKNGLLDYAEVYKGNSMFLIPTESFESVSSVLYNNYSALQQRLAERKLRVKVHIQEAQKRNAEELRAMEESLISKNWRKRRQKKMPSRKKKKKSDF